MSDNHDLDPIDPSTARELFLDHKATHCTEKTVRSHKYRSKHFSTWCDENGIDNMNDLSGRDLHKFRLWHMEEHDINKMSLRHQMCSLRVFLKWAASIEAVPPNLYDKVMVPTLSPGQRQRDDMLEADAAEAVLEHLWKFHFASREHAIIALLWETGIRLGAANSIDLSDVNVDDGYIRLVHRPEEGTTLKNGKSGERPVAITDELAEVLRAFVEHDRADEVDDYGREPLFTSCYGRLSRTGIRRAVYKTTAPCFRDAPCPGCEDDSDTPCPESVSPHAIRRGSITHFLTEDVPTEVVSDRMNVSRDVLEQHYDRRSEEVKLEQRRGYLENI
ncbi:tyrosine-type recombinase/integrase [Halopenitus salinus]|uniref:Tyrosine-type recombinase/integrase n=1 Tax=Halopenitus salinus TaxID=1198295 RepID=A0ABD5UYD7_9EURY